MLRLVLPALLQRPWHLVFPVPLSVPDQPPPHCPREAQVSAHSPAQWVGSFLYAPEALGFPYSTCHCVLELPLGSVSLARLQPLEGRAGCSGNRCVPRCPCTWGKQQVSESCRQNESGWAHGQLGSLHRFSHLSPQTGNSSPTRRLLGVSTVSPSARGSSLPSKETWRLPVVLHTCLHILPKFHLFRINLSRRPCPGSPCLQGALCAGGRSQGRKGPPAHPSHPGERELPALLPAADTGSC